MLKKINLKTISRQRIWFGSNFFEKNFPYIYQKFIKKYYLKKLILNIKAFNYLKSINQLEIGQKLKLEIEKVELNINKKKCSKLIFGSYIDKADIIVRQNILHFFILEKTLPCFTSNLLSAVKKNYFFIHPLPSEYNDVLKNNGFKLSYKNALYWYFYIFLFFGRGIIEVLKIIFFSLLNIFFIRKQVSRNSAYFTSLDELALPKNLKDVKKKNIINWYIKNKNFFNNMTNIYHNVKSVKKVSYDKYNINYSPIVPPFVDLLPLFFFIFWAFAAILLCLIDIIRGRWWHSLLLRESAKLKLFSLQNKNHFNIYLFNNSNLKRPLWSYEAEKRDCKIFFYFYSTSNQHYLSKSTSDPTPFGWRNSSWSNYLVWDIFQKKFVEKYINNRKNINIVGPIWFSDFDRQFIKPNKKFITVFPLSPWREAYVKTFMFPDNIDYYINFNEDIVDYYINFLEDIYEIAEKFNYLLVCKNKRSLHNMHHPKYVKFLNNFSKLSNALMVPPNTSALRIIEKSSKIITAPFSSPSIIGKLNKIPSIYYDPRSVYLKNNPAAHDVEIVHNKSALEKWIINN